MSSGDSNRYAAAVLRNLRDRIDDIENAVAEEGVPNVIRTVTDTLMTTDTVSRTVTTGASFSWDGGEVVSSTVTLFWEDNSAAEDRFNIYRATGTSPSWPSDYRKIDDVGPDVTTYEDTDAPTSSNVHYAVTAENASGESLASTASTETGTETTTSASPDATWDGGGQWG